MKRVHVQKAILQIKLIVQCLQFNCNNLNIYVSTRWSLFRKCLTSKDHLICKQKLPLQQTDCASADAVNFAREMIKIISFEVYRPYLIPQQRSTNYTGQASTFNTVQHPASDCDWAKYTQSTTCFEAVLTILTVCMTSRSGNINKASSTLFKTPLAKRGKKLTKYSNLYSPPVFKVPLAMVQSGFHNDVLFSEN